MALRVGNQPDEIHLHLLAFVLMSSGLAQLPDYVPSDGLVAVPLMALPLMRALTSLTAIRRARCR